MINDFVNEKAQLLGNLYGRWIDEREYEDFSEYISVVEENFKRSNVTLIKMTKRFNIIIALDEITYMIKVRSHKIEYGRYQCGRM